MNRSVKGFGQALALMMLGSSAFAQESSGEWRQTVALYGMGAAIEGDATAGPLTVPVDLSISDVFSNLDGGAMAAYRIDNGTWSFTADATYMDLGFSRTTEQGRAGASLSTEQLVVMGTVGRRVHPNVEILFSLGYFDVSADLDVRVLNQTRSINSSASWTDPLFGLEYRKPLNDKWSLSLRGDIGGFGVGSDLTVHGWAKLIRRSSDKFAWFFGYRYIAYDYEEGSGLGYQRYDFAQQGPGVGVLMSF